MLAILAQVSALFLLATVTLLARLEPPADAANRLEKVPLNGLSFRGEELELTDAECQVLGGARALKRIYETDGRRFLVLIIDGTGNGHAVHDPIYCQRGKGFVVVSDEEVSTPRGKLRSYELRREEERLRLAFWYADGESSHASFLKFKWQSAMVRATRGWSGRMPLLVAIQPLGDARDADWLTALETLPDLVGI